ncbi:MAG: hypothetical protein EXR69_00270 [Myxococcales bacterium]|nr:hypothetical protein [Myxococcales bacterium]
MPRPFFPHTFQDVTNAVDGGLGLIVADMPDGSIWVCKRDRKQPGTYEITHYSDMKRTAVLSRETVQGREDALRTYWRTVAGE